MNHPSAHLRRPYRDALAWDAVVPGGDDIPPAVIEDFGVVVAQDDAFLAVDAILVLRRDPLVLAEAAGVAGAGVALGRNVSVALQSDMPGQWMVYSEVPGQEHQLSARPWAHCALGSAATTAVWRFFPDAPGPVSFWAYLYVDGRFVPFRAEPWSAHYVDLNGAVHRRTCV